MSFDGAKIHFFPDILTVFYGFFYAAERERMKKKRRAAVRAVAFGAALLCGIRSRYRG
jgi:hypothetical protein